MQSDPNDIAESQMGQDNMKPTDKIEEVRCECCGMAEECTPTYISRIRENYYGKWLCGLCSEAVKEKKRKYHTFDNKQALEAHMAICRQFNTSTRVNPNLTLADAMVKFARKRSQLRRSGGSYGPQLVRSCSCQPWLGVNPQLDSH